MRIHFISIGGIAMHNLAIALHLNGDHITGSDDGIFEPSYSNLKNYGLLPPTIGWFPEKIEIDIDLIILGMHAKIDNPELIEAKNKGIKVLSYPEFLYEHSKDKIRVVIAGSHGKSTITAMIIHVLNQSGIDADYMVGAQMEGYDVMARITTNAKCIIIEGDEYPTSPIDLKPKFLHYKPNIAVISGIAWDHIDQFPSFESYIKQFQLFIDSINSDGLLIYNKDEKELNQLIKNNNCRKTSYTYHPYKIENGITHIYDNNDKSYSLNIFGLHNMYNLNAALLVCNELGISNTSFYKAISSYKSASKRLELLSNNEESYIYRDFAHTPNKVKATVSALRMQYPNHKLIICLELHCYTSMCEIYIDQYKHTLEEADSAIVFYDPNSASYKNIPIMTFERIKEGFLKNNLQIFSNKEEMINHIETISINNFVLAFLTSGRFGGLDLPLIAANFKHN